MKRFIFENEKQIERVLRNLFQKLQQSGYENLYDALDDNDYDFSKMGDPIREIFKNKYIRTHYESELILEILDILFIRYLKHSSINLISNLYEYIRASYNDWVVIFPIEYCSIFSKYKSNSLPYKIDNWSLITPRKNKNRFITFFCKEFKINGISKDSLDHALRVAGNYLLTLPLFYSKLHGTRLVVQNKGLPYFDFFKALNEIFVAGYDEKDLYPILSNDSCDHFYLLNIKNGDIERKTLWDGSRIHWCFKDKVFKLFLKRGLIDYFSYLTRKKDKMFNRLLNSIKFFSKGFNEDDKLTSFMFYLISMESIFSKDKNNPIRVTLADYISLLCYEKELRIEMHKKIKDIYDTRSGIVHSGNTIIKSEIVEEAKKIASRAIIESLKLYHQISQSNKDPENQFFDHLLNLKLS